MNPQALLAHVRVAFAGIGQAFPHRPQCEALPDVSVSQPSVTLALQSPHGALHVYPHVPLVHVRIAFTGVGQAFAQAPQCERFEPVLISHPSPAVALQSA